LLLLLLLLLVHRLMLLVLLCGRDAVRMGSSAWGDGLRVRVHVGAVAVVPMHYLWLGGPLRALGGLIVY
jgi:hypothetical protein